ncbi:Hint domain-containing protein [Gluconacetobacter sacchari]|uniref:Hint domain-containing protein n=1 Tax=Gluconacetobacter sacchari TaxID=92759 RepID=UPI0039B42DC2
MSAPVWRQNAEITRPVIWVGKARCTVRPHLPDDAAGWPVRIRKDAFADGVPYKDMLITAEHCLFFDGGFVPARMLVNGGSIFYDKSARSYMYYHIETEQHAVVTADGMLTESYLDTGNRDTFRQNGKIVSLVSPRELSWNDAGAPLRVDRAFVEPLFRRIDSRCNTMGIAANTIPPALTDDMDLHLALDSGAIIRPARTNGNYTIFLIPTGVESVRIVSRASRPCDVIGPFVDDRRVLGIAIGEISLFEDNTMNAITHHLDPTHLDGWHILEWPDTRWTDGNAVLALGRRPPNGVALLALQIKAAGPYLANMTVGTECLARA